ncbi:NAD(P)-binding domain-containing protein [Strongyloides ratti]|uniref:NAD(P)-binding domain-containing protein n=1 Tax=Strongyloides ratti TaxID=34506 RepID=A0A090LGW7_STRRB|nr:NAD(P)-binding domain-containing protein [Strongyloides ratti]CEF66700.1 NAD(P)-binding domain-containing protein [Strongyloides ratti]
MDNVENICIFGYNNFIGQRLELEIKENHPAINIKLWQPNKPSDENSNCKENCQLVYNVVDYKDWSIKPNKKMLEYFNETIPEILANECENVEGISIVHLSSTLSQASSVWPTLMEKEKNIDELKLNNIPFRDYTISKINGEKKILNHSSSIPVLILRSPPCYGEGDTSSVVIDSIKILRKYGCLPKMSKDNGSFEMCYIGNITNAMVTCGEELLNGNIVGEVVILGDDTLTKNIRESVIDKVLEDGNNEIPSSSLPLTGLFFVISYFLLVVFIRLLGLSNFFKMLPDYNYFVLHYRNWVVYDKYKLMYFIGWKPKYSREEAFKRSSIYYKSLFDNENLHFSWIPYKN